MVSTANCRVDFLLDIVDGSNVSLCGQDVFPQVSEVITPGFIVSGGDLLNQMYFEGRRPFSTAKPIDFTRLAKSYLIGFAVMNPNLYVWYNKLLPRIMAQPFFAKQSPLAQTMYGTAMDQGVFAWNILTQFFFFSNLLEVGLSNCRLEVSKAR